MYTIKPCFKAHLSGCFGRRAQVGHFQATSGLRGSLMGADSMPARTLETTRRLQIP